MTRRIVLDVYERDGVTHVGTLTQDSGRAWLDELYDVGSGRVTVPLGSTDAGYLTDGRMVQCQLDGTARFTWIVEAAEIVVADDQARSSGRLISFSGRGNLALLERPVVYPELAIGRVSPESRYFGPQSKDFDDSGWSNAVQLKQVSDASAPWSAAPAGFPDQSAYWIGKTGDSTPGVAPGRRRVRKQFTIASGDEGDHVISTACDDAWIGYMDGDLFGQETEVGVWGETRQVTRYLDVGTHTIFLECENFDRTASPTTNVFGVVCSVAPLVFGNMPGAPIVSTDNTWKIDDLDTVPGMFVGDILDVLLTEAAARATLDTEVAWDFTDLLDSNAAGWIDDYDVAFPVSSTSYLDVVRHFIDEHAADFWMDPSGYLHAYLPGTRGSDLHASVTLAYATNIGRLKYSHQKLKANRTLSRTALGRWVVHEDTASITAEGGHEIGLSLGSAPSDSAGDRISAAFLADAVAFDAITDCQVEEITGAVPYVDWTVGDQVSATGPTGSGTVTKRCVSLAVSEDAASNPRFTPELVDPS